MSKGNKQLNEKDLLSKLFSNKLNHSEFNKLLIRYPKNKQLEIFRKALALPKYKQNILKELFPKEANEINTSLTNLKFSTLDDELNWISLLLISFANCINDFIVYENQVNSCILSGEYEKASTIIDKIEKEICMSLWCNDLKITLNGIINGFENNLKYINTCYDAHQDSFIYFFDYMTSLRVEENMYPTTFKKILEEKIKNQLEFGEYFKFKIQPDYTLIDVGHIQGILYIERHNSIIDLWQSYKWFLTNLFIQGPLCFDKEKEKKKLFLKHNSLISNHLNDMMIQKLSSYSSQAIKDYCTKLSHENDEFINAYYQGQYRKLPH